MTEVAECPTCGSTSSKPIVWGYPSADDFEQLGESVVFGGCCLPERPAAYQCARCGDEFGLATRG